METSFNTMTKFRLGDKVRIIRPCESDGLYLNDIHEVGHVELSDMSGKEYVYLKNNPKGKLGGFFASRFELVPPSPKFKVDDVVGSYGNSERRYKVIGVTPKDYILQNHQKMDPIGKWLPDLRPDLRPGTYTYDHDNGDAVFFLVYDKPKDPLEEAKRLYEKWYKEDGENSVRALAAFLREVYQVKPVLNYIPAKEEITFEHI